MKPIFEQEKVFLNNLLGLDLPNRCWRDASKIYLDFNCAKPLYQFKVEDGKAWVTKDNSNLFTGYNRSSIDELIEVNRDKLINKMNSDIDRLKEDLIQNHGKYDEIIVSHSGGKDSTLSMYVFMKTMYLIEKENKCAYDELDRKWFVNFANTSNDTAATYLLVKKLDRLNILNPEVGFYQWIKEKKRYMIPSRLIRNCCSTYKEGQITKAYDKDKSILMITGVRKYESTKRAKYEYYMDSDFRVKIHGKDNLPSKWVNIAPIVEWRDEEVWLFILMEGLEFNKMYELGFNRVGCLICPYQSNYIDLLIKEYYPSQWERWMKILEKNYESFNIGRVYKWTLEEWKNGRWKDGTSKENALLSLKCTDERVKELAKVKGCSEDVARKFWNRTCSCGKKLNPSEVSMYLKLYGRFEGMNDNRIYKCKTCLCEDLGLTKKQYKEKQIEFYNTGCNLF